MDTNDLIVYGLLGLALLAVAFIFLQPPASLPGQQQLQEIQPGFMQLAKQAGAGAIPDKCKVPPGVDPAQWKQHLGHHPDQYGDCPQ